MAMTVEEFIAHHGVKGMRWGVRNARSRVTSGKSFGKHPQSFESKKVSELRKRKPHQLTNKQLETVNKRQNLESQFSRMNPTRAKKGKAKVTALLATAGLAVSAYNMATSPAGKAAISKAKKFLENDAVKKKMIRTTTKGYQQLSLF